MNLCIIAILFEKTYYSIQCQYKDASNILHLMKTHCATKSMALQFVVSNNLDFKIGKSDLLKNDKIHKHQSSLGLVTYAVNTEANDLYVFEDNAWDNIPLIREELLDVA